MNTLLSLALLLLSAPSQAAVIGSCDGLDSIGNLIGNPRTFANGEVKVAYVTTEEPAAAPDHLLIFVYDNEMGQNCFALNAGPDSQGFGYVDLAGVAASYDVAKGLLLSVPVFEPSYDGSRQPKELVKVRVNRKDSTQPKVTIER
jgi:hypothetical protein